MERTRVLSPKPYILRGESIEQCLDRCAELGISPTVPCPGPSARNPYAAMCRGRLATTATPWPDPDNMNGRIGTRYHGMEVEPCGACRAADEARRLGVARSVDAAMETRGVVDSPGQRRRLQLERKFSPRFGHGEKRG